MVTGETTVSHTAPSGVEELAAFTGEETTGENAAA